MILILTHILVLLMCLGASSMAVQAASVYFSRSRGMPRSRHELLQQPVNPKAPKTLSPKTPNPKILKPYVSIDSLNS